MLVNGISLGSSVDTSAIIEALVNNWRSQQITPLEERMSTTQKQSTALSEIINKLSYLKSKILSFESGTAFLAKAATSSDESRVSVAATEVAASGTYNVNITQLAAQHKVASAQFSAAGTDISDAGTGTMQFRLSINGVDTDINLDVNAGDSNQTVLTNIATAINSSGAHATAIVVNETGSSARLVITSGETGLTNAMTMQDLTGSLLQTGQVIDASNAFLNELQAAQDALLTVDSLSIQRSSNVISDAIGEVTLNLKSTGAAVVEVSTDTENITEKIQSFIDAYNEVISFAKEVSAYDTETKQMGVLINNPVVRELRYDLRSLMTDVVSGITSDYNSLGVIGIEVDKEGTLAITDSDKLESALQANLSDVKAIFNTATTGVAVRLNDYIDLTASSTGALQNSQLSYSDSVKRLEDLIAAKERALESYQQVLILKFTALDSLLTKNQTLMASLGGYSLIPSFD